MTCQESQIYVLYYEVYGDRMRSIPLWADSLQDARDNFEKQCLPEVNEDPTEWIFTGYKTKGCFS